MNISVEKTEAGIFEIERADDTIVVTPVEELGEFDFQRIEAGAKIVLELLENPAVLNVVMDFHRIDYYGSTAVGFFVALRKGVKNHKGRMAFCNVSSHGRQILRVCKLEHFWPIYPSKEEALAGVRG